MCVCVYVCTYDGDDVCACVYGNGVFACTTVEIHSRQRRLTAEPDRVVSKTAMRARAD